MSVLKMKLVNISDKTSVYVNGKEVRREKNPFQCIYKCKLQPGSNSIRIIKTPELADRKWILSIIIEWLFVFAGNLGPNINDIDLYTHHFEISFDYTPGEEENPSICIELTQDGFAFRKNYSECTNIRRKWLTDEVAVKRKKYAYNMPLYFLFAIGLGFIIYMIVMLLYNGKMFFALLVAAALSVIIWGIRHSNKSK